MKTLIIEEPGKVSVIERNAPEVKPEEILVRLKYVGFCGSDLSTFLGKNPMVQYPRIPGHEISGVIHTMGAGVPEGLSVSGGWTAPAGRRMAAAR